MRFWFAGDHLSWWVYIIHCDDDSLYTGISVDIERRFDEHAGRLGKQKQAKYFYGRKPLTIVYRQHHPDRSSASQREAEIKKLSRAEKLELIQLQN